VIAACAPKHKQYEIKQNSESAILSIFCGAVKHHSTYFSFLLANVKTSKYPFSIRDPIRRVHSSGEAFGARFRIVPMQNMPYLRTPARYSAVQLLAAAASTNASTARLTAANKASNGS